VSQAGIFELGNPGALDVQTLTGNIGGAVGPTAGGNINILGDNTYIRVTGNPGTNTLTISELNSDVVTGQTIGAVTADIFTLTILNPLSAVSIVAEIMAASDDYLEAGNYFITGGARRAGGVAVLPIGGLGGILNATDFALAAVDIVVSGNDVIVRVTGEALTTINWRARVRYQLITL
jgi:hypothetical protein